MHDKYRLVWDFLVHNRYRHGFHTLNPNTDEFKELLIRWFQFASFSPILRMHGDRHPHKAKLGTVGGGKRSSGMENEIFSYGITLERILTKFIRIERKFKGIHTIFI